MAIEINALLGTVTVDRGCPGPSPSPEVPRRFSENHNNVCFPDIG
jgi:hypothetical protein